jgi:cephalosporin-C deacetylase-like acetyl esterase
MRSVNEKPCLLKKVELVTVNAHQVVFKPTRGYKVRGWWCKPDYFKMRVIIAKSLNFWY